MTLERCMDGPWRKSWRGALILGNYEWPSYWHRCTKGHIGQCRGQIGWRRALRERSLFLWMSRFSASPNHVPGWQRYVAHRLAAHPHPCA